MKHIDVKLLETEQKIAKFIANLRTKFSRSNNYYNNKVGKQSKEYTELEGIGSELAAAKLLNVWPDLDPTTFAREDFNYLGYSIDVKTTKYPNGRLILPIYKSKENKACDYYMLMLGEFPSYRLSGFASKEDLISEQNISTLGYNKIYMLEQEQLKSFEDFINETKARA